MKLTNILQKKTPIFNNKKTQIQMGYIYLDELDSGDLEFKTKRLLCFESLSGVSSTMRDASKSASSSQPAIAAADLNLGLISDITFWLFDPIIDVCSSLSTIFVDVFSRYCCCLSFDFAV
jgi:hypothetical protein